MFCLNHRPTVNWGCGVKPSPLKLFQLFLIRKTFFPRFDDFVHVSGKEFRSIKLSLCSEELRGAAPLRHAIQNTQ